MTKAEHSRMTTNPQSAGQMTRRAALRGTAAIGAAVLPAGVAMAATAARATTEAAALPTGTDPHIGWWRDRQQLSREIDELESLPHMDGALDEPVSRQNELDNLIVGTPPTTLEGAAIVATALLWWQDPEGQTPGWGDIDKEAGGTLARYFLAGLPPDVLQRAGMEDVA